MTTYFNSNQLCNVFSTNNGSGPNMEGDWGKLKFDRNNVTYTNRRGEVRGYPMAQVKSVIRDEYRVDIEQMPDHIIAEYIRLWQSEFFEPTDQLSLYTDDEIYSDLWSRHVPDKNVYAVTAEGRRVVQSRVFQRRDAHSDAFYDCEYCVRIGVVCRDHQFQLDGNKGVVDYVRSIREEGSYRFV